MTRKARTSHGPTRPWLVYLLVSWLLGGCYLPLGPRPLPDVLSIRQRPPITRQPVGGGPSAEQPPAIETTAPTPEIIPSAPAANRERLYITQAGDTLLAIASRFAIPAEAIVSNQPLPAQGFLVPGQVLTLPTPADPAAAVLLLPDSRVVFGPGAADFDIAAYLERSGGYLASYQEFMRSTGMTPAAEIIHRVAIESSVDPRLLLALLEHECNCVRGLNRGRLQDGYVLNVDLLNRRWLYGQLSWAADQLFRGYYGWRTGKLHEVLLPDFTTIYPAPELNAGSLALYTYFSELWREQTAPPAPGVTLPPRPAWDLTRWQALLDPQTGFMALYSQMFDEPWQADFPLLPGGLQQPVLSLPFVTNQLWSLTSGPHSAWEKHGSLGALDFSPVDPRENSCDPSNFYATAIGSGPVVRSGFGMVIQDLDMQIGTLNVPADGREDTGWVVLYLHVASNTSVPAGTYLRAGDPVGRPSCEGGPATGAHLHLARKYNGEWIEADGPVPFVLDGWLPRAGDKPYLGTLQREDAIVTASPYGASGSLIRRSPAASATPNP